MTQLFVHARSAFSLPAICADSVFSGRHVALTYARFPTQDQEVQVQTAVVDGTVARSVDVLLGIADTIFHDRNSVAARTRRSRIGASAADPRSLKD